MTRRVLGPGFPGWDPVTIVGRVRELELLGRVVAATEGGAGGVALVEGEPGIGKTCVLEALAASAGGPGRRPTTQNGLESLFARRSRPRWTVSPSTTPPSRSTCASTSLFARTGEQKGAAKSG